MTAGASWGLAYRASFLEMIPSAGASEAVTTDIATLDLSSFGGADLRNRWVYFTARGAKVALRRFTGSAPTIAVDVAFTLADAERLRVFVAPGGYLSLRVIASASGSLVAEWSGD